MMIGYIALYGLSVVMFFFLVGVLMLPAVIIAFPIAIYKVWAIVMKPVEKKTGKILLLLITYLAYVYLTYRLDTYISWSKEGNLKTYLSFFGF